MPTAVNIKKQIQKYGKVNFIKGELTKRDLTLKKFAKQLGISESFMYQLLRDYAKSRRIAKKIEDFLEVPRGSLFPYVLDPVENSEEKSNQNSDKTTRR